MLEKAYRLIRNESHKWEIENHILNMEKRLEKDMASIRKSYYEDAIFRLKEKLANEDYYIL